MRAPTTAPPPSPSALKPTTEPPSPWSPTMRREHSCIRSMLRGHQRKFFFNSAQLLTPFSEGKNACVLRRMKTEEYLKVHLLTVLQLKSFVSCPATLQILTLPFASQLDLRGVWKPCMVYLVLPDLVFVSQTAVCTHSTHTFPSPQSCIRM